MATSELTLLHQRLDAQMSTIREMSERIAALECRFELSIEPRHKSYLDWKAEIEADRKKVWLAGWGVAAMLAALLVELGRRFWLH